MSGADYDVVGSLIDEVDGRMFLGKPLENSNRKGGRNNATTNESNNSSNNCNRNDEDTVERQESEDNLRLVSHKVAELKSRHRKGRWSMQRLSQFGLPLGQPNGSGNGANAGAVNTVNANNPPRAPRQPDSDLPYKPRKRGMLLGPLRLHSFVELSRGLFAAQDINATERKILAALEYQVNPPTGNPSGHNIGN